MLRLSLMKQYVAIIIQCASLRAKCSQFTSNVNTLINTKTATKKRNSLSVQKSQKEPRQSGGKFSWRGLCCDAAHHKTEKNKNQQPAFHLHLHWHSSTILTYHCSPLTDFSRLTNNLFFLAFSSQQTTAAAFCIFFLQSSKFSFPIFHCETQPTVHNFDVPSFVALNPRQSTRSPPGNGFSRRENLCKIFFFFSPLRYENIFLPPWWDYCSLLFYSFKKRTPGPYTTQPNRTARNPLTNWTHERKTAHANDERRSSTNQRRPFWQPSGVIWW